MSRQKREYLYFFLPHTGGKFFCVPNALRAIRTIIFFALVPYSKPMLNFLPPRLADAVRHVNLNLLYELRIRAGKPLRANVGGRYVYLGPSGICGESGALIPTKKEVEEALFAASDYSVYAVEEQMRSGFVTARYGERVGVAGTAVTEGGRVHTVRDVTSLCIRIPHEIHGCADRIYRVCLEAGPVSLLIMAPPGEGKTTILRELCRLVSTKTACNLLVCDERGELSAGDLGATADVIRFADKLTAFTAGIRAMRPDVIVTDELLPSDYPAVRRAIEAGVKVFASAHLTSLEGVTERIFERYILLDGLGNVKQILNAEGEDVD